jgi:hypothetical protein
MDENIREFDKIYNDKLMNDDEILLTEEQIARVLRESEKDYETEMILKQLAEIEINTRKMEEKEMEDKKKRTELFEVVLRRLPYSGMSGLMRDEIMDSIKLYKNLIINKILLQKDACNKFQSFLKEILPKIGESAYNEIIQLMYI